MYEDFLIFDIEANGLLDATKIHCIVTYSVNTGELKQYYKDEEEIEEGLRELQNAPCIVGHNIIGFDIPLMQKLYPWWSYRDCLDTLVLSRLFFPNRNLHSIESYSNQSSMEKVEINDWSCLTYNMLDRCSLDVLMTYKDVFNKMKKHILSGNWYSPIHLEHLVYKYHQQQLYNGVVFDVTLAHKIIKELDCRLRSLSRKIKKGAPLHTVPGNTIKKVFKKDGSYMHYVQSFLDEINSGIVKTNIRGPFSKVYFEELNLNSSEQVKDYLKTLGWRPTEWNYKKLDDGTRVKTSPKLTEDSYDSIKGEIGKLIAEYNTLKHRRNTVLNIKDPENKGMLNCVRDDGRIEAHAITCGTPTARYTHKIVANIPRVSTLYGREMRSLFSVSPGSFMVGVDLSGIEARILVHYCYNYLGGKEFAELVLEGDFHQRNADIWGVDRDTAKSILYALMYGAGPDKLGSIAGGNASLGKKLKRDFLKSYPAYAKLIENIEKVYEKRGFIRAIDGRRIFIRQKYRLLNSLIQTTAAVIFKKWMVLCNERLDAFNYKQLIAYHDELQVEYKGSKERAEKLGQAMVDLIKEVGDFYKLNIEITGEYKVGKNWAETH